MEAVTAEHRDLVLLLRRREKLLRSNHLERGKSERICTEDAAGKAGQGGVFSMTTSVGTATDVASKSFRGTALGEYSAPVG